MLDFVGFISDNVNWNAEKKAAMLNDFCAQYGYQEEDEEGNPNPVSKKDFANEKIALFIKETVNAYRRSMAEMAIEIEELDGDL